MPRKLIVAVQRVRETGRILPRHRLAFPVLHEGVLSLLEERVADWNRSTFVAKLLNSNNGALVDGVPPLLDARIIRAMEDEWILTGLERVSLSGNDADCAQTWMVRLVGLQDDSS